MNKLFRISMISALAAATCVAALSPASARDRYRYDDYNRHHHRNGDAAVLGVLGLAAGVAVGAAIANQPRYVEPEYVEPAYIPPPPPPVYYPPRGDYREYRPAPVSYAIEPWTPGWYRYCANRYRSFSPDDGTYVGYDGRSHFCVAG